MSMKISVTNVPPADLEADAVVLAYAEDAAGPAPWEALDAATEGLVAAALASPAFRGKDGQTHPLPTLGRLPARELVLSGLGRASEVDAESWRRAVANGCTTARGRGARTVAVPLPDKAGVKPAELAGAACEAAVLATYRYQEYKKSPSDQVDVESVLIATSDAEAGAAVERARTVAEATCWARDLVNRPSNAKRTHMLAEEAVGMAEEHGLRAEVLEAERCAELGMNALLAVGAGSDTPPRLVVLEHRPDGADGPPVALVGKGITFDSGGLSIKPSSSMSDMKSDMAGAAAVFATMRAVAELGLQRPVIAVAPLAENLLSASSYRPGDILRAYSGTTIEVVNTDAEGRLVLADALAWVRRQYEPACIVDLATLTGACVVALGNFAAGLMGSDESLCDELQEAGEASGERLWRLPVWRAYDQLIDSDVADVKNSAGREAGAITAAKFLQRFVGDTPWAHLDIAGTAFLSKAAPYQPKGGTGFGVRLLTRWLQGRG